MPPLKLYLLPISTRRALIYCDSSAAANAANAAKPSILDRVTNKANQTWADFEKSNTSWKQKLVMYGNMMFKRIPFEEWGLKSIPPLSKVEKEKLQRGVSAAASSSSSTTTTTTNTTAKDPRLDRVELRYPGRYLELANPGLNEMLRKIATERQDLHRKRMWYSLIGAPFTAPVAILPIIPNIPFFYLAFRAWSHWRALRGSEHLQLLLEKNYIKPMPSSALDNLYTAGLLYPTREESRKSAEPSDQQSTTVVEKLQTQTKGGQEDVLLLHGWNGKLIAERLKLPSLETEIERAVEQVQKALQEEKKGVEGPLEGQAGDQASGAASVSNDGSAKKS